MSMALSATQPTPTCTEQDLVAAVRGGSDRAFEELYSRYRSRISSYILGMVGDHARAEDIAQEVFISALRRLRQTDQLIVFKPWIYEIAKNACIDEFRRTKRAREVPLEHDDDESDHGQPWLASGATPEVAIDRKQSLEDLRRAFHSLSENHHKVIVMREFEGLSYGQIGQRLGMTRPVVESTLFRARRRLSEEYNELVSGRRCQHVQALIVAGDPKSLLKLGVRERRQLARHLAHCQPCRRQARMAGVDESLFHAPGFAGKVAALLPIPWLWRRRSGSQRDAGASGSTHSFALLQPLQTAARFADTAMPSAGLGRVATAAAALAVAGLSGGVVAVVATPTHQILLRTLPVAHARAVAPAAPARHPRAAAGNPTGPRGGAWVRFVRSSRWTHSSSAATSTAGTATSSGATGATSSSRQSGGSPSGSGGLGSATQHPKLAVLPGGGSSPSVSLPKISKPALPSVPRLPSGGRSNNGPVVHVPGVPAPNVPPLPKVQIPNPGKLLSH